ncbi:hypothetical protein EOD41_14300 [Mucilaginibacter limnophilus]|uniref:Tetratricopeptide repeat protein n=1 Tax=Mucilaginibacter limnophilus TaxID=1932778 RepID=A0A437MR39_9SPHI|nr:hypothetical protein [Mucilaginibacter limnophilus]RVU00127.1 hypothetical protein EOD41_14300 [Mucilaginibacter limnophilus]
MKRITKYLAIFFVLWNTAAMAQSASPHFLVYYVKGKGTLNKAGQISALKKSDNLYQADKITVAKGGEVMLLCAQNSLIKVTAGSYAVKNLISRCKPDGEAFTAAYFHYIWHQMSHHHEKVEDNPEKFMKTAGAVARGKQPVELALPVDTIYYSSGALNINWKEQKLLFKLYADSLAQVTEKTINLEKTLPFGSVAARLEPGSYLWQLCHPDGKECGSLNYLEVIEKQSYNERVISILKQVIKTTDAETAFMSGFLLEQHHFLAEATKYYKQAASLDPSNKIYTNTYYRFL